MTNQEKAIQELQQAKTFREIADRHERNALKLLGTVKKGKALPIEVTDYINRRKARQGIA